MKVHLRQLRDFQFDIPNAPKLVFELDHTEIQGWLVREHKSIENIKFVRDSDCIKVILNSHKIILDGHNYEYGTSIEIATIRLKVSNLSDLEYLRNYLCPDLNSDYLLVVKIPFRSMDDASARSTAANIANTLTMQNCKPDIKLKQIFKDNPPRDVKV